MLYDVEASKDKHKSSSYLDKDSAAAFKHYLNFTEHKSPTYKHNSILFIKKINILSNRIYYLLDTIVYL